MIKSLHISNFKRIEKNGIDLQELAPVNFLVGENGCGKSSILEALQYFYIFSPRNTQIEAGLKEVCEILELVEDKEVTLKETIENQTEDVDLHFEPNRKMFHPKGMISICSTRRKQNKQSISKDEPKSWSNQILHQSQKLHPEEIQHNTFHPVIVRCDGMFHLQEKYEDFGTFLTTRKQVEGNELAEEYIKFLLQRTSLKREITLSELNHLLKQDSLKSVFQSDEENLYKYRKLLKFLRHLVRQKDLSGAENEEETPGEDLVTRFALGILFLKLKFKMDLFLIEEPENHLHPKWQKLLPVLFNYFSTELNLQFIITTHSPFMISASSQLTQDQKDKTDLKEFEFDPPQKVYFLKDGNIANKRGEIEIDSNSHPKGRFGYWGNKCIYIASKMLGTGLLDLISPQFAVSSADAPTIIFCEGEGNDEDARLYNIIFDDLIPPVLFISARGSTQLYRTFEIIREIKKGLAANFRLKMVRDRDHDFGSEMDIERYEKSNSGVKILRRRAIECYLFNSETARLWLKKEGRTLNKYYESELDQLQLQIQKEAQNHVMGNDYKIRLKDLFLQAIYTVELTDFELDQDFKERIATLITPQTNTYQELYRVIFE